MNRPQRASLHELQPSQLYLSRTKLAAVAGAGCASGGPLPVRRYGEHLVLTDGHTRAFAALQAGLESVDVVFDEDDLDDEAYEVCVAWCLAAGIRSVADLAGRVLDPEAYERLWRERCRDLHRNLSERRGRA